MKKVILFLFLIIWFIPCLIFSQSSNNIQEPHVLPPTPDAAALGKYGNYPVGLNTGIPDISIPIYTIKTKKLELPISVSYHASGIRVNEFASWVGLGWALNAGGAVTRSAIGEPDDHSGLLDRYDVKNSTDLNSMNYWDYMRSVADNTYDTESDYYFYNFPGHSGKFVYPQNSATAFLIPQEPISVQLKNDRYIIKDEAGVTYKFLCPEMSRTIPNGPFQSSESYISSYYLSEIVSADGYDHIYFTYQIENSYAENNMEYTRSIGKQCDDMRQLQTLNDANNMNICRIITPVRLKEITFSNGKVEFLSDTSRSDAPDTRLGEIKIYQKNSNGTYSIIKSIVFGEDYFDSGSGISTERYRLMLKDISEKDKNGTGVKKYSFSYNYDSNNKLPPRDSYAQDWWGFYNGHDSNTDLIARDTITYSGITFNVGNANRNPDSVKMQACILKKITHPTGGYTEFDYSPNYYSMLSQKKIAGGLRVKEIRDYENDGTLLTKKIYSYGEEGSGMGTLLIPEEGIFCSTRELDSEKWYQQGTFCNPGCWAQKLVITGRPGYELTTLNGSPVGYSEVAVSEADGNGNTNGTQVHRFNVVVDNFTGVHKAYNNGRFQSNDSWKGGYETYAASIIEGTSNMSNEILNTYSLLAENNVLGTKIGWKVSLEGCPRYDSLIFSRFYYFDYQINSGIKKLTGSVNRQYSSLSGSEYTETKTLYAYDSLSQKHQQLSSLSTITSRGDTIVKKFWYPADYNPDSLSVLLDSNIISIPIKEETYRNNKQIDGRVTRYNNYGDPHAIFIKEMSVPADVVAHDPDVLVPTGYSKRMDLTYGSFNSLETVEKSDDIEQSYIWGYGNSLPVAEVKNTDLGAMSSNYSTENDVSSDITTNTSEDTPLSSSFEIRVSQNVSPDLSVSILGSNGPPSPYLAAVLKNSEGQTVKTHNCVWGTNSVGTISLSPGVYQWYYSAIVDAGGGFNGYHIDITTSYTGTRTGYKAFHTSFEDNGIAYSDAKTGKNVWSGIYTLNLPGHNGDYKLTYWQKTGTGAWTLNTQTITVTSGTVQTTDIGSAGSYLDELRLVPSAAGVEIKTYTYEPLKGITSVTDQNQVTTYYEYDDFGRLKVIKDNKNNILKTYTYHYKE